MEKQIKLCINIEIDGNTHVIQLNHFQDPYKIAQSFIRSNQLDETLADSLANNIGHFLKNYQLRQSKKRQFENQIFQNQEGLSQLENSQITQETNKSVFEVESTNHSQLVNNQLESNMNAESQVIQEESQEFLESEASKQNSEVFKIDEKKSKKFQTEVYNRLYDREKWKWQQKREQEMNSIKQLKKSKTQKLKKQQIPKQDPPVKIKIEPHIQPPQNHKKINLKDFNKKFYYQQIQYKNHLQKNLKKQYQQKVDSFQKEKEPLNLGRYVNHFYYEGFQKQQLKQQFYAQTKQVLDLKRQGEPPSFRPEINQISEFLSQERKSKMKIEDYLLYQGQEIQKEKLEKEIMQNWALEQQCTFHPQINPLSTSILKEKRRLSYQRPSFKPQERPHSSAMKICSNSRKIFLNSNMPNDFIERQNYLQQKSDMKRKIIEETLKHSFHPQLMSKQNNSMRNSLPIGTYLFEKSQTIPIKKNQQNQDPNLNLTTQQNNALLSEKRKRIGEEIWECLAQGQNSVILREIDEYGIPVEILLVLAPFLIELEYCVQEITKKVFIDLFSSYYLKLGIVEKQVFEKQEKQMKKNEIQQPELNKKSLRMAKKRKEKIQNFHQNCTKIKEEKFDFKPKLNGPYQKKSSFIQLIQSISQMLNLLQNTTQTTVLILMIENFFKNL